ncbi:penicillin-binding protein 1C [Marinoscillum sp. MHG1-6]|uniref:penicillin-binding protein 1C n=1 Tax=Marinoscillum sp. MHG1-6 TaxID=2959627 RepID=UPI0021584143|nr:penicillin-binding protein 1C [Marinoscillum sp. MHG1-6]
MKKRAFLVGSILIVWTLAALFWPVSLRISRDYSQVILAKDSTFLRVFLNSDKQWCLPPQLDSEIPANLRTAVLTYEDQYFDYHPGVNPIAILRAAYLNAKHQKVVSGGSTITMQVARMMEDEARTLFQKLIEIVLAIRLEAQYSKEEILREYLTHAPYGSNIRGFSAASFRYFEKKPDQLSWAQAATLAVLPNAPGLIFPGKNNEGLKAKRDQLLSKLLAKREIDQETFELSLLEPIPSEIIPFPLAAPHLTERIHLENELPVVYTTIDQSIQYETNFFLKQHAAQLQQMGIMNACALVVNNKTGEVASYVGSQNFDDLENQGRVDGVTSQRSSGSILKPFLYAAAIDEGLILPNTLIKDVPTYFESFSPNNASEQFSGIIPASKALIYSLNIPAVRLLNMYGLTKFYNLLESAGVQTLFRTADDYGLPLILGGSEVTPWDMAKLYSGLAKGGMFSDITYLKGNENESHRLLISSGASNLILEEMKELIRPGLEFYWKRYGNQKPIAWKTGTSYGHKDAWAVGATPDWTIVVWVGNFNGESNKGLSGMRSAGPLLFNILNILPESEDKRWFESDEEDFTEVKICSETGFYANPNCANVELSRVPVNMKPMRICPFHEKRILDESERYIVCSRCWGEHHVEQNVLRYPPDVNYYLWKNGGIVEAIPPHNPKCPVRQERDVLKIIYPLDHANLFVTKDFDGSYQPVVSRLATQFPDREVFWYLDDEFLGSTIRKPSLPLKLKAGAHQLAVVDSEGNRDEVGFSVIIN